MDARVPERASRNIVYMVVISSSSFTSARRCASTNATAALKLCWLHTAALMNEDSIGSARAFSLASRLHVHPGCGQVPPTCIWFSWSAEGAIPVVDKENGKACRHPWLLCL